jgi:HEAT repeat protein
MCCLEGGHGRRTGATCDLDSRSWSFNASDDVKNGPGETLAVYARVSGGKVDRVRALSSWCPASTKTPIRELAGVTPDESVAWLAHYAESGKPEAEHGSAAIAYHAVPSATHALAGLAEPGRARDIRESALFWLGQRRGADGLALVERFATRDADPEIREHAVFVLSEAHDGEGYARILSIAGTDADEEVRSKALFWMAQMHDPRAAADITAAIRRDPSDEVREQGVFALSQLDKGADQALIAIIRGDFPRSAKEKALFWLGQSGSDEALAFLDEVLAKSDRR